MTIRPLEPRVLRLTTGPRRCRRAPAEAPGPRGKDQGPQPPAEGKAIGGANGIDAGGEDRGISHAFDAASVHELGISSSMMGGGHEHALEQRL